MGSHDMVVDLSPLTSLSTVQFLSAYFGDPLRGTEKLLDMPNIKSIAFVGEDDHEEMIRLSITMLEKGARKDQYSVLRVNAEGWRTYQFLKDNEGDEAVLTYFRHRDSENQDFYKVYQDCYNAHILCGGFDGLMRIYPDSSQIDSFMLQMESN